MCKNKRVDRSFTEGSLIRLVCTHTSLPLLNASAGEMLAALEEAEVEHRGNYNFVKYHKIKLTRFHDFNYGFHNRILKTYQEILPSCFYEDLFCKWPYFCINYAQRKRGLYTFHPGIMAQGVINDPLKSFHDILENGFFYVPV